MSTKPFLFQFAKEAGSPPAENLNADYYFDPNDDLLHKKTHPDNIPAIDIEGEDGPRTKKHDVEKDDDSKDQGIWL
jgi:hypothetical protein